MKVESMRGGVAPKSPLGANNCETDKLNYCSTDKPNNRSTDNVIQFPERAPKPDERRLLTINIYALEIFSQDMFREMLANMHPGDTIELVGATSAGQVNVSLDCVEAAR